MAMKWIPLLLLAAGCGHPAVVLIGSNYDSRPAQALKNLKGTPRDAAIIRELFAEAGLRVVSGGGEATVAEMRGAVDRLQRAGGGVFYFSGHCSAVEGQKFQLESGKDGSVPFAQLTGRPGRWIYLLDCCDSGKATLSTSAGKGRQALVAAGRGAIRADDDSSPFARALRDGYRTGEADANCDGAITVGEAAAWIDRTLLRVAGGEQRVSWKRDGPGDLVLFSSVKMVRDACRPYARARERLLGCMDRAAGPGCPNVSPQMAGHLRTLLGGRDVEPLEKPYPFEEPSRKKPLFFLTGLADVKPDIAHLAGALRFKGHEVVTIGQNGSDENADLIRWLPTVLRRMATVLRVSVVKGNSGAEAEVVEMDEGLVLCNARGGASDLNTQIAGCLAQWWTGIELERFSLVATPGEAPIRPIVRFRDRVASSVKLEFESLAAGNTRACPQSAIAVGQQEEGVTACESRAGHCVKLSVTEACSRALAGAHRVVLREE